MYRKENPFGTVLDKHLRNPTSFLIFGIICKLILKGNVFNVMKSRSPYRYNHHPVKEGNYFLLQSSAKGHS